MFAFKGDYRMQCCISFLVGGGYLARISLAFASPQRRTARGLDYLAPCEHRSLLTDSVPQLALADAICLLPSLHFFDSLHLCTVFANAARWKFVLAAGCALAGNYSFVQGNLIWVVTLPVILFAPEILSESARPRFAAGWLLFGLIALRLIFQWPRSQFSPAGLCLWASRRAADLYHN